MKWQDFASTAVNFVFIGALLPSLFGTKKPVLATSAITAFGLAVWTVVCFSLHLWFTGVSEAVATSLWCVLGWQVRPSKR